MTNKLGSNKLRSNKLHKSYSSEPRSTENKQSVVKKIIEVTREGFRYRGDRLEDVLMDKVSNPTPRSELFPYRFYDEGLYYMDDNIVGFIIEGNTAVGIDDVFYKQVSLLFDDQLPEEGVLEVLLLASDDLSPIIDKWSKARIRREGIYRKLEEYRTEFFNKYNEEEERSFKHRNYRVFFSYSNTLHKGAEKIIKFRGRLKTILSSIGIQAESLGVDEFIRLVKEITNYPDFKEISCVDNTRVGNTCNEEGNISDQICDVSNALLVGEEGVLMDGGKYTTRIYEVEHYPNNFSIGSMACLLGDVDSDSMQIPSRFGIVYTISNEIKGAEQER